MTKKGLGRGLGALIPELESADKERQTIAELEIKLVDRNPQQPRREFDSVKLNELADSVREHGVVQPIVVKPVGERYQIVAGERRWRAAQLAGLTKVPAVVRSFTEQEQMEIALIENLQREDLNPLEEAEAYRVLLDQFGLTQEELSRRLGKSRPQISNTLRLLQLPDSVRDHVRASRLSMGHAKVLLGVDDTGLQQELADVTLARGLSVRELEAMITRSAEESPSKRERKPLTVEMRAVEGRLREYFGTPVKLQFVGEKGKLEITFFGEDGLQRIMDALGAAEQEGSAPRPPKRPFVV
ncbi:MAG TPA: ParB/RepB/Spo0J family partition protein [Symbiobacteriaceae bacterium]|nr:ParB/RepB/Spo0J family partition protein [Symbiobacteriaceae bacterium]